MELKKKTIIWEDNTEPPKNYIWIKSDGKAYEFDYNDRKWKESQIVSSIDSGNGGGGSGETTFDGVVKYYTGYSLDEIDDWKIIQTLDIDNPIESSLPYVKFSGPESPDFFNYMESEDNYWHLKQLGNLGMPRGVLTPSLFDSDSMYAIAEVQYAQSVTPGPTQPI